MFGPFFAPKSRRGKRFYKREVVMTKEKEVRSADNGVCSTENAYCRWFKGYLAVIYHFFITYPFAIFTLFLPFFLLITFQWHILIIYGIWYFYDRDSPNRGGYQSDWFLNMRVNKWFADYFPVHLHKTAELPPDRNYLIGCHPHGIIAMSAYANFGTNGTNVLEKGHSSTFLRDGNVSNGIIQAGIEKNENEEKIINNNEEKMTEKEEKKVKTDGTQEGKSAVSIPEATGRGCDISLDNYLNNLVKTKTLHSIEKGAKTKRSEVSTTKIECKTQKSKKE